MNPRHALKFSSGLAMIAVSLHLMACGQTEGSNEIYEDDESVALCLVPEGEPQLALEENAAIEADQDLTLLAAIFLISSIERGSLVEEYCTMEMEDDQTLRVRTWIEFGPRSRSSGMDSAAPDPRLLECQAPTLEAGSYTVLHGEKTFELEVPSEGNLDCGNQRFQEHSHRWSD